MNNAKAGFVGLTVLLVSTIGFSNDQPIIGDAIKNECGEALGDNVSIKFSKKAYTMTLAEVAKGVQFDYVINVEKDIQGVVAKPQDIGAASAPGPSGLYPFESITGNGQSYSLSDIGLGQEPSSKARTISKGRYRRSVVWDGRNWSGPSDFCNPKGKAFPPGVYKLTIRVVGELETAEGGKPYSVTGNATMTLTN